MWVGYVCSVGFRQYASALLRVIEKGALSEDAFNDMAIELFTLQHEQNAAYRKLCESAKYPRSWQDIPAVPTAAFKELELTSIPMTERTKEFRSSGTTGQKPSRHFHSAESLPVYEASLAGPLRENFLREEMELVSLTPSARDAPHSSLVHMFSTVGPVFVGRADWSVDLTEFRRLRSAATKPIGLMGTAFNFVQLIDEVGTMMLPSGSRVLETGGYKGRSREVSRKELHEMIRSAFGMADIVIEYGMCELSSQAYAHEDGIFRFPPWVRAQIVSPENGREVKDQTGLVRVLDLANVWSVMAVQTEDLGLRRGHGFELLGRASGAEARGCSLMSR
jgi:hypothetical protein